MTFPRTRPVYQPSHAMYLSPKPLLLLCSTSSLILASLSKNYLPILYSHLHFGLPLFIHIIDHLSSRNWNRYSDQAMGSTPGRCKSYALYTTSRPTPVATQPPIQLPPVLKRTMRDAELENECSYTSTPHTIFHGMNRDTFTFTFI